MAKHLQIEIDVDTAGKGVPAVAVTPIDLALPGDVALLLEEAISAGDLGDPHPGDGQFEESQHVKVPVKFLFINLNVEAEATAKVRVVERP